MLKRFYEIDAGVAGDALLYLGPAAEPVRRIRVRGDKRLSFADQLPRVAAPPRPWRPR